MTRRCCGGEGLGCYPYNAPCKKCYEGGCAELGEIVEDLPFEDFIAVIFLVHNEDQPEETYNQWTGPMESIHSETSNTGLRADPLFKQTPGEFRPVIYDIYIGPYYYSDELTGPYYIPDLYGDDFAVGIEGSPTATSRSEALEFGVKIGQTAEFKDSFSCTDFDAKCKCIGGHETDPPGSYEKRPRGNVTMGPFTKYLANGRTTTYYFDAFRSPYITPDMSVTRYEGYIIHGDVRKSACADCLFLMMIMKRWYQCACSEKNIKISLDGHMGSVRGWHERISDLY